MRNLFAIAGVFTLIAVSGPVLGADNKNLPMCTGCHGADGTSQSMPDAPIIAGIPAAFHEDAMFAYQDGGRSCGAAAVKCQMIGALSEDDIVELAAHFAKLPFKPAGEDFDAALAAEGKAIDEKDCAMCHGLPGAKSAMAISMNGQKIAYLRNSLLKYISGEREEIKIMQDKLTALTPEQTEAILNFYASYREAAE